MTDQSPSTHSDLSARVQLADSHLTYIGSTIFRAGERARYDVYPCDGGNQLGWVVRLSDGWHSEFTDHDACVEWGPVRRTRWEAATAVWGSYPRD